FNNEIKQGIEVIRHYEELPRVLCYPDELNQVWSNLIHNAIQSMEGTGTLEINVCLEDGLAVVTVTDSGKGIPDGIKQRIFEPFFTTKPQGKGSGLGLDIVRKIIEKHKGNIRLESAPGRTVFSVIIPIGPETGKDEQKSDNRLLPDQQAYK
ncbi:MAG: GHKL domain-containing protein, partial [Lentisphaerae bacterium]|nr:GHKL domain-containing protein [Lentisphaerota bacterium]